MPELVFPTQKEWSTLRELGLTEHSHNKVIIKPMVARQLIAKGYDPDDIREAIDNTGIIVGEDPDVSLELITSTEDLLINHLDLQ